MQFTILQYIFIIIIQKHIYHLVYGRAALLGLISGDSSCTTAYPRCPRNEDELLYYLNNHRGGFFRFFNGGAAFGDDQNNQYNPNQQQYQQNQNQNYNQYQPAAANQYYQQGAQNLQRPGLNQPSDDGSLQSNLAALQNIADAINNSGGINLSNLGANTNLFSGLAGLLNGGSGSGSSGGSGGGGFDLSSLGNLASLVGGETQTAKPSKLPPNDQGQSLTELVGNLLTGFVGQRFNSRKIKKRSIDVNYDDKENSFDDFDLKSLHEKFPKKISAFKLKLAASKTKFSFPEELELKSEDMPEIESRILNKKPAIYSDDERNDEKLEFNSQRENKKVQFANTITGPTPLPSYASNSQSGPHFGSDVFRIASNRRPKISQFQDGSEHSNKGLNFNQFQQQNIGEPVRFESSSPHRPQMIFPDRTGTGNLRFDNDEFNNQNQQNYYNYNQNRYGKILNYGNRRPQINTSQVSFGQNDRYSTQTPQSSRPFFSTNNQGHQNQNNYYNQNYPTYNQQSSLSSSNHRDGSSSQNIYVTNGHGKIVYYINAHGNKVYV